MCLFDILLEHRNNSAERKCYHDWYPWRYANLPALLNTAEWLTKDLGVGAGMKPPRYLVPGNVMEVQIDGIGTLRNVVKFA